MQLFIAPLLLFFLLSFHVATVTAWAGCHRDRDKDHRTRENCTALGFSDVPTGFETSTKVLLFPNNLFSSLSWSSFQIFIEIYELDFTGNKISEVISSVTPILPTLCVLRLGSNHLTSLSDGSFSACPALTELYLDNNAVDSLSDRTFSGLSKLEILDLSSNRIKVLPKLMLHPFPAIETLYLKNNTIKVMPDDWFSQKEEVPYLFLSANPWECSCSISYFRRYLDEFESNIYIRNGPDFKNVVESVVCDSPPFHQGKPLFDLEEDDLCSTEEEYDPIGPTTPVPVPTTTTPIPVPTAATSTATPAFLVESSTEHHRVVTRWQTFTRSGPRGDGPLVRLHTVAPSPPPPLPTVRPSTESPANMLTATPTTARSAPSTVTSTTPKQWVVTITATTKATTAKATTSKATTTKATTAKTTTAKATTAKTTTAKATTAKATTIKATTAKATTAKATTIKATTAKATTIKATTTSAPSSVIDEPFSGEFRSVRGAGVFCFWLFAGCLLLCVAMLACILATLAWLVIWYRRVYKPLSLALARRGRGGEAVRLLTYNGREGKEVAGGGGGVMALYRSVLFVHRDGREAMLREDRGKDGEGGGEGVNERLLVTLEPTGGRGGGGGAMREEEGGKEDKGVYRKTLYRVLSKEEEIEGWRDVMEEWQVSAEDGGRRRGEERSGGGGGASRKCYSVILREEREEASGGREELDWVVGGWEIKGGGGGGEGPRSSWGEWLAHYLPSMPWGVTTPPEGEAALSQET